MFYNIWPARWAQTYSSEGFSDTDSMSKRCADRLRSDKVAVGMGYDLVGAGRSRQLGDLALITLSENFNTRTCNRDNAVTFYFE